MPIMVIPTDKGPGVKVGMSLWKRIASIAAAVLSLVGGGYAAKVIHAALLGHVD